MLVSALLLSYLAHVAFGNLFPTLPPPTQVLVKPGACPPPSSIMTSIIDPDDQDTCKTDNDCGVGTKKCCQSLAPSIYVCWQSSTDVPSVASTTMSSTDAPHVGTCPEDSNMSPSSCKVTCTSDASCDASKKCCQVATCGTRHCLDAVGGVTMGPDVCLINNKQYLPGERVEPEDVPDPSVNTNPDNYECTCTGGRPVCVPQTTPTTPPTEGAAGLAYSFVSLAVSILFAVVLA